MRKFLGGLATLLIYVAADVVVAQPLLLTGVGRGGAVGNLTVTSGHAINTTAGSPNGTYTFASQAVGAQETNRIICGAVAMTSSTSGAVTSVTLGGVSATKMQGESGNTTSPLELWCAVVPTGTSISMTVVYSVSTTIHSSIAWWSITGTDNTSYSYRADATTKSTTSTGGVTSGSLTIPPSGIGMAAARIKSNSEAPITWSQSSGSGSKRQDTNVGTNQTSGSYDSVSAVTTTISAVGNLGTNVEHKIVAISWEP